MINIRESDGAPLRLRSYPRQYASDWLQPLAGSSTASLTWEGGEGDSHLLSPLWLLVGGLTDDAKAIDLARDPLRAATESRLGSAQLHVGPETKLPKNPLRLPSLSVDAEVVGFACLAQLELEKNLIDPATGEESMSAGTRGSGRLGTQGKDAGYIVQLVAEELDKFLAKYLRVNEKDCPR